MTTKKNYEIGTEAKSIIVHNAAQAHMTASDYFNNLQSVEKVKRKLGFFA